jgi:predicted Zn-dependent protease with MMP-like domain
MMSVAPVSHSARRIQGFLVKQLAIPRCTYSAVLTINWRYDAKTGIIGGMQDRVRHRVERARLQRFERIVARALDDLPPEVATMLNNVHVIVENEPTADQIAQARAAAGLDGPPAGDEDSLFGLYEGVPLTQRGGEYHLVPPDRITIFRGPLERACASPQAIAREVRITVMHELGHHLGFGEDRLAELGLG